MEETEIDIRFSYHKPSEEQIPKYEEIRAAARHFALLLDEMCPESREKALAMTHLEDSVMWANAAIARRS